VGDVQYVTGVGLGGQHEKPKAPRERALAKVHQLFVPANTQTDPNTAPN
jgi:hypothetical protein